MLWKIIPNVVTQRKFSIFFHSSLKLGNSLQIFHPLSPPIYPQLPPPTLPSHQNPLPLVQKGSETKY